MPAPELSPVLAFGFDAPALLWWGLALGGLPLVIHLLGRRKYRETNWAAMRFLLEAVRKNSRRLRIEQLVLLAVRTLILLLVVAALSGPRVADLGALLRPRQPAHKIIVIDASLSMGLQSGEASLFQEAKAVARRIVERGEPGDVFNLVRLSNIPPAVMIPTPAYETAQVIAEIEQMQLPHGLGDLPGCLAEVDSLLKLASDVPQKEVFFISDFQRATWTPATADEAAQLKQRLSAIDQAGRLVLVDVGQADKANVALTALDVLDSFVTIARPARFRAVLRNFGDEPVIGRLLELAVDDLVVDQRSVDLAAGGEVVEDFSIPLTSAGERRVQARIQSDALPLDDKRWAIVPVRDRIRVLCVDGGSRSAGGRSTDYLALALAPGGSATRGAAAGAGRSQIEPTVVSEGELQAIDLSLFDCVFFCNVRLFTDRESQIVEAFLQSGGGVVWCLGDHVSPENYNQVLYRQGAGCLPAHLGDRQGDAGRRETVFSFDPRDSAHPIVNPFQGNPDAGLETTQTYNYIRATLTPQSAARVALAFDSGDPAIVAGGFGRGRTVLVTTSVDERWGTWPLWPSFLPLVHEIVHYGVSGRWGERQRLVGESLTETLPATAADVDAAVITPDGQMQTTRIQPDGETSRFVYDVTPVEGVYEVSMAHPVSRTQSFAVNVDPRESNLARIDREELAGELLAGVEFAYETDSGGDETTLGAAANAGRDLRLARWLLYALLYLVFTEQLLAWNFQTGLWLLCPLVPAATRIFSRP